MYDKKRNYIDIVWIIHIEIKKAAWVKSLVDRIINVVVVLMNDGV